MEEIELMEILENEQNENDIKQLIDEVLFDTGDEIKMSEKDALAIFQQIIAHEKCLSTPWGIRGKTIAQLAKVAIVIMVGAAIFYLYNAGWGQRTNRVNSTEARVNSVSQAGNQAVLTLSDGTSILLDSIEEGSVIQGNIRINKQDGILIYDAANKETPVIYNTLSTPSGGQYQVLLPDGSKVWLNASSSLSFPTAFNGPIREIAVYGEAYFEVAKNEEQPFRVKVGDMDINVIGTHFNVSAYKEDKKITTSLIEGSIQITQGNKSVLLKPGEQGIINDAVDEVDVKSADMEQVIAWKEGVFYFEDSDIESIMSQISRWYNVDVKYMGAIPKRSFNGKITRNAGLHEILQILELQNIKFRVEGREITVL